jgi:Flp pilus assembly pilin Flp
MNFGQQVSLESKGVFNMMRAFWKDDNGFVVSAELVLIGTILVIGMIVGLSEVQHAVVQELNDVADAIGSINQSFSYSGFRADKSSCGAAKSFTHGSQYNDRMDDCDNNERSLACERPVHEGN